MKHTLTILTMLVLTCAGALAQNTFSSTYNIPGNDVEWDNALHLSDSTWCLIGYYGECGYSAGLFQKMNVHGTPLKNKVIDLNYDGTAGESNFSLGVNAANNQFTVSGRNFMFATLTRVDNYLAMQWSHRYFINNDDMTIRAMIATPENGVVMGVSHDDGEGGPADALIKTDSLGNILWSKEYLIRSNGPQQSITKAADGGYIVANVSNYSEIAIIKTDTAGNVLWNTDIEKDSSTFNDFTVACSPSGSIYVSAERLFQRLIGTDEQTVADPVICKLDALGNLVWAKENTLTGYVRYNNKAITFDKQGNPVMAGILYDYNGGSEIDKTFMYKTDTLGSYIGSQQFTAGLSSYITSLAPGTDSGFIATGSTTDSNYNNTAQVYTIANALSSCFSASDTASLFGDLVVNTSSLDLLPQDLGATTDVATSPLTDTIDITVSATCSTLPVHLTSFTAALANGVVNLQWKTASEQNASYYAVERSKDISNNFAPIKQLAARNLLTAQTYTATDENPLEGTSYYRLRSVDVDGKSTVSKVVPINITSAGTIYISPNPVTDAVHVHINAVAAAQIKLQVSDMAGKVLLTQNTAVSAGANSITLPALFAKGIYILKVLENGKQQSMKFIK